MKSLKNNNNYKMAEEIGLQEFLKIIEKKRYENDIEVIGSFLVLDIRRYLSDQKHRSQLGIQSTDGSAVDVVQITLTDEKEKIKAVLDPRLNSLVQKNQLQAGSVVTPIDCLIYNDEMSMLCDSVIIVKDLTVVDKKLHWKNKDWTDVRWLRGYGNEDPLNGHITSGRGYFLNVWSSMEVIGEVWKTNKPIQDGLGEHMDDIFLLRELHKKMSPDPMVLVRVLMKFRLYHYAKPSKDDKWPFQAQMLVGDSSGMFVLVLWNKMCPEWYYSLSVGDVLLIRKFVVKSRYQTLPLSKVTKAGKDLNLLNFDLSINSHHPPAEVTKINPQSIPKEIDLPSVVYKLASRKLVGQLQEDVIVDIAGVVTYIGRYQREPTNTKFGEDSGSFWIRQWIYLHDGSSKLPFKVQLYHAAIGISDLEIKPGKILFCSNVRVVRLPNTQQTSRPLRHTCLTSTGETEVKLLDDTAMSDLKEQQVIADLVQWSKTQSCHEILDRCGSIGGHCQGLPLPCNRQDVWDLMKDSPPIPSDQWLNVFTTLKYRETRQVAVYAYLVSVTYHPGQLLAKSSAKKPKLDFTLDVDVKESYQNLALIGSDHLDTEETFPAVFSEERWPKLKQRLDFPCVDLQSATSCQGSGQLEVRKKPYFTFLWIGVNKPTLLYSHLLYQHDITDSANIIDILSGQSFVNQEVQEPSYRVIHSLLTSAKSLVQTKMHVVLDFYQYSDQETEIMLHRAFRTESA